MSRSGLQRIQSQISQFSRISTELDKSRLDDALSAEATSQTDDKWTETMKTVDSLTQSRDQLTEDMKTLLTLCGQQNCPLIVLTSTESKKTIYISRPDLQFCRKMVKSTVVHITAEGELVNGKDGGKQNKAASAFIRYYGTCSIVCLPLIGCPQYWEVITGVGINRPLTENILILEIGLCWEEERDVHHCICGRPHSCSMIVVQCPSHSGLCRNAWKEGKRISHTPNTLPNIVDASATLHYGVAYDIRRKKVVFIDVSEKKVLQVLHDVDSSQPLWPMFGVYNSHLVTVNMSLVVGKDIELTEEKKQLIAQALLS